MKMNRTSPQLLRIRILACLSPPLVWTCLLSTVSPLARAEVDISLKWGPKVAHGWHFLRVIAGSGHIVGRTPNEQSKSCLFYSVAGDPDKPVSFSVK